jgi:hypothetical protein
VHVLQTATCVLLAQYGRIRPYTIEYTACNNSQIKSFIICISVKSSTKLGALVNRAPFVNGVAQLPMLRHLADGDPSIDQPWCWWLVWNRVHSPMGMSICQ